MSPTERVQRIGVRKSPAWSFATVLALALAPVYGTTAGAAPTPENNMIPLQQFQIRAAQEKLSDRGFNVKPTGEWDEPTRSAIAGFQASKGLPTTGRLDLTTADRLGMNMDPAYNCEMNNTVDCGPPGD
jgi:peptidoglycan hydrolase-like protein with peptidoglycan-binding domain